MPRPAIAARCVLDEAGLVEGVGVDGRTWRSRTVRPLAGWASMTAGVVPQSLMQLEARGPLRGSARSSTPRRRCWPLPSRATLIGRPSIASNIRARYPRARRDSSWPWLPSAGPVPPAIPGGDPGAKCFRRPAGARSGVRGSRWRRAVQDAAVAGDHLGRWGRSPAAGRPPSHRVGGCPPCPERDDAARRGCRRRALMTPPVVEHDGSGDDRVEGRPRPRVTRLWPIELAGSPFRRRKRPRRRRAGLGCGPRSPR